MFVTLSFKHIPILKTCIIICKKFVPKNIRNGSCYGNQAGAFDRVIWFLWWAGLGPGVITGVLPEKDRQRGSLEARGHLCPRDPNRNPAEILRFTLLCARPLQRSLTDTDGRQGSIFRWQGTSQLCEHWRISGRCAAPCNFCAVSYYCLLYCPSVYCYLDIECGSFFLFLYHAPPHESPPTGHRVRGIRSLSPALAQAD